MSRLSNILFVLRSFLPRKLPTGMTQFNLWLADIIRLTGLPDNASTRRTAAGFIFMLPPGLGYLSIRKISNALIKAAANQVAQQVSKDTQEEQNGQEQEVSGTKEEVV